METNINYYEILEVDQNATADEIRRAYHRKIRIYSNETHPEQFKLIRKAYETLYDSNKRAEYDRRSNQNSSVYDELLNRALASRNNGNYQQALNFVNELIANFHGDPNARYLKADILADMKRFAESKSIINQLRLEEPNNLNYLSLSAYVYYELKDYYAAISALKRCIELDPNQPDYYLQIANNYLALNDYNSAIEILEERLQINETIHEFPLILELFYYTNLINDDSYKNRVMQRIKRLPKNSDEKRLVIDWIIESSEKINIGNDVFSDLVDIIKYLNSGQDSYVNRWIQQAERQLGRQNSTSGNNSSTNRSTQQSQTSTYSRPSNPNTNTATSSGGGPLVAAIIIGIIFSFIFTPFGGLIAGVVYYFFADAIKSILSCLGCGLLILIALGIILGGL